MAADLLIRVLEPDDAGRFFALRLAGLEESPLAFGTHADEYRSEPLERVAAFLQPGQGRVVLGAEQGGQLVGTVSLVRQLRRNVQHKASVNAVYVKPEARGQGVGEQLMRELLAQARQMEGLRQVQLSVTTSQQAALRLYRRLGFETYGHEREALIVNGTPVDEDHLQLDLT
ncbi:GNAT family N-acetyltransferase [Deinococcus sonorensis]|uniref:GNAT family N-acetyltransferase n=2 Tax=Deinococcus sonorensis TaxID=309891 RepID=A0AAU7UA67_9DEIO